MQDKSGSSVRHSGRLGLAAHATAAHGTTALQWLKARGWVASSSFDAVQLSSDELTHGGFFLRRTWITRTTLTHSGQADMRDSVEVTLMVEGSGTAQIAGQSVEYSRGTVLQRSSSAPITIEMQEPTAFVQLRTRRSRFGAQVQSLVTRVGHDLAEGPASVFLAMTNAVFAADLMSGAYEFALMERGLEAILDAVLIDADGDAEYPSGSPAGRDLHRRATTLIRARATDPHFTLDALARELAVSKPYLQRVFRATQTTPLRYLQEVRAAEATRLLADCVPSSRAERQEIAERSGFTSSRAMSEVLARVARRTSTEDGKRSNPSKQLPVVQYEQTFVPLQTPKGGEDGPRAPRKHLD